MLQNDIIIGRLVLCHYNHICCEMVGVLASSAVERGFGRVNPKVGVLASSAVERGFSRVNPKVGVLASSAVERGFSRVNPKVGVLASNAVERGFSRVNPKTITLVFAASPIDRHNYGLRLRTKTGWSG